MEDVVVRGVALDKNQAKITLVGVPDKPGVAARVFRALADAAISVDMIVQNVSHGAGMPLTDLSFTVDKPDLAKARHVIDGLQAGSRLPRGHRATKTSASSRSSASACAVTPASRRKCSRRWRTRGSTSA